MLADSDEEWPQHVRKYVNDDDIVRPWTHWAGESISVQLMRTSDGIDVLVEVIESYSDFDGIGDEDCVSNAGGELSDIGEKFVDTLADELGNNIQIPYAGHAQTPKRIENKVYKTQVYP